MDYESSVEAAVDELYELIQNAKSAPLSSTKCVVERDRILDLLDEIHDGMPDAIKNARVIVDAKNDLIGQARKEAEVTVTNARSNADAMLTQARSDSDATVSSAKTQAETILANARAEAEKIVKQANAKADQIISKEGIYTETQKRCDKMVEDATKKIDELKKVSNQYMDDALKRTEDQIAASLADVKSTREKFRTLAGMNKKIDPPAPTATANKNWFTDIDV